MKGDKLPDSRSNEGAKERICGAGLDELRGSPAAGLLMGTPPDVASKRLHVLHIRPNLPEN
jgi:hypothetical protein